MSAPAPTANPKEQGERIYGLLIYTPELDDTPQSSPNDTDLYQNLYRDLDQANQAAKSMMDELHQSFINDDYFDNNRLKRHTLYNVWHEPIAIELDYHDHTVAKIEIRPVTLR